MSHTRQESPGFSRGEEVKDLYLDDAGRPHVIELNPQSNSGLYALDMDALLTAIGNNPAQFMPDPKRTATPGCLGVRGGRRSDGFRVSTVSIQ